MPALLPLRIKLKPMLLIVVADVVGSLVGAVVWLVALVSWCIVFSIKRSEWGELADALSFIIPKGVP